MSTEENSAPPNTAVALPEPNLSDLERQKAEIEAIQAQMMQLHARVGQRLDERRTTIDLTPADLTPARPDAIPPTAE
ncbi:hypothetical protein [Roseomonas genomospecies 6]|uniref:Uncharacterized protein n=1 Tax=Roseomonas genomospecies 6 TaxID=214106 RepID=A0A9W7NGG9_9PROT|nr:hypothetical protein [Roseomonas genomospecies 6]KAA0677542.1 hypothetical protein DS843_23480 [Roseomonas genomospecies 6]